MPNRRTSRSGKPPCSSPSPASRKRRAYGGSTRRSRLPLLLAAGLLLTALGFSACNGDGGEPPPTTSDSGEAERVAYQAEDGLRIIADFYAPLKSGPTPAVLLLHQFGGSRAQWADLIPDILQWGYAVLAPDLRSFGESTVITRAGEDEDYTLENLDDMVLDVAAAIEYLKTRREVSAGQIGVVGASVGANLAYVASGAFPEVLAAVSMSPNANPQGGVLLGKNIPGFSPRAVLFMSDVAEAGDAQALAQTAAEPVNVIVYEGASAHGVQLLPNPQVKPDMRGWLAANLPLSSGD
ncbi:MAG: alpha/beta fold hydrolase [Chloroflexi bacterium]|nr:alpha/beta fold hydrolase [Chloroflexota bacterium]